MDSNGRVPVPKLQNAVAEMASSWGLDHDTVMGLLRPEGILTAVHATSQDASGELLLARGEFLAALDARAVEKRVCRTIQLHLVEVKQHFYQQARASGVACSHEFEVLAISKIFSVHHFSSEHDSQAVSGWPWFQVSFRPWLHWLQDAADGWTPHGVQALQKLSQELGTGHGDLPDDPWSKNSCVTNTVTQIQASALAAAHLDVENCLLARAAQHTCANGAEFPGKVFVVFESDATCHIKVALHVGQLPDPHANDPSTPPMASVTISLDQVYEILHEQLQDPAKGWGVLMEDVKSVLRPERFVENAGMHSLPVGKITWPVFVRTVLYLLHR